MISNFMMVIIGGGLGALCRHIVSLAEIKYLGTNFPIGTLLVNMTGCFLIGVAFALIDKTNILTPSARLLFMTGFLGSLTTFSTYALETVKSLQGGSYSIAFINFAVNNIGGIIFVMAGVWAVKIILKL